MVRCSDGDYEHPSRPIDCWVALKIEQVRACYEGDALERATAVAKLSRVQRQRLFPRELRMDRHGDNLRRVGARLVGERVRAMLAEAPFFPVLLAAARHKDEDAQIASAIASMMGARRSRAA